MWSSAGSRACDLPMCCSLVTTLRPHAAGISTREGGFRDLLSITNHLHSGSRQSALKLIFGNALSVPVESRRAIAISFQHQFFSINFFFNCTTTHPSLQQFDSGRSTTMKKIVHDTSRKRMYAAAIAANHALFLYSSSNHHLVSTFSSGRCRPMRLSGWRRRSAGRRICTIRS